MRAVSLKAGFALLLALVSSAVDAQPEVGFRTGANVSRSAPGVFLYGETRVGPAASVSVRVPVRGRLSLRPEVLYSSEGERLRAAPPDTVTFEDGSTSVFVDEGGSFRLDHVGVGAFLAYEVPVAGLAVEAYGGPAATAKVRERHVQRSNGETSASGSSFFGRYAVTAVGGVTATRGPVGLDVRYAIGLTDALNRGLILGGGVVRSSVATVALVYRPGR
ncbi:MAG TPA: outer membrane beta-barrel protein [Rubricoccaceae bacterium]